MVPCGRQGCRARDSFHCHNHIAAEVSSEEEEPEYPFIGTIVVEDVSSAEEEEEEEYPFIGTIAEETLQEEEDVVFDTAGDDPFGIEVDDAVDQVVTVSDAEHESMVLFLAAFTTAADVPVEEDETPAPIVIEPSTTMPVVHEDVAVEAPAEVAVEEPLVLDATVEPSNSKASRIEKSLESTLDGYYWSISEGRCHRRRKQPDFFSPC